DRLRRPGAGDGRGRRGAAGHRDRTPARRAGLGVRHPGRGEGAGRKPRREVPRARPRHRRRGGQGRLREGAVRRRGPPAAGAARREDEGPRRRHQGRLRHARRGDRERRGEGDGGGEEDGVTTELEVGLYIFMLAGFLGYHIITRVPPLLHTPLMSATNAIAAISLVGSLVVAGSDYSNVPNGWVCTLLGFVAVTCSSTNAFGGFLITDRMLRMFKTAE